MSLIAGPSGATAAAVHHLGVLGVEPSGARWVDGCGVLHTPDGTVRCWIGAADRWLRPGEDGVVRQHRQAGAPVVATSVRVPGGDVRIHTFATILDGAEWIVTDVHNETRIPVLLAVVCEPSDDPGAPAGGPWTAAGPALSGGGRLRTLADRPASDLVGADTLDDLHARLATLAGTTAPGPPSGGASHAIAQRLVAQLFAVPHGTGLRLLVAPGGPWTGAGLGPRRPTMAAAPDASAVARGWQRQLDAACRVDLGEEAAAEALLRARTQLLLDPAADHGGDLVALAALGHRDAALGRLHRALERLRPPVQDAVAADLVVAAATIARWSAGDGDLLAALLPPIVETAGWVPRRSAHRPVVGAALRRLSSLAAPASFATGPAPVDAARSHLGLSSWWRGCSPSAGELLTLRSQLLDDELDRRLDLLPGWPAQWRARPLDVHDLPTAAGALSFAVRWHGARPALLWELDEPPATRASASPFELRCSGLDPSFTARTVRGEALLAPPNG